jgi:hypothetical protein
MKVIDIVLIYWQSVVGGNHRSVVNDDSHRDDAVEQRSYGRQEPLGFLLGQRATITSSESY